MLEIFIKPQSRLFFIMLLTVVLKLFTPTTFVRSQRTAPLKKTTPDKYRVNFVLPDELPVNHFIGNIPDQLPRFPLNSKSDFSVSTTVVDKSGLAPRLLHTTDSGDLYTSVALDRDNPDQLCGPLQCCKLSMCNLTFTVLFVHPRWQTLSVHVNLQFHDVNDNEPKFPQETFSIWIPEDNALEHSTMTNIERTSNQQYEIPHAYDYDSEPNGVISYSLLGSHVIQKTFELFNDDSSGQLMIGIKANARLDYENPSERIFKLTVEAHDGGSPSRKGTMLIMIHITDLNDNPPVFESQKHSISLAENTEYSKPIYTVYASDADSEDNGLIRYTFGNSYPIKPDSVLNRFTLHPVTGEVLLRQTLDYENYEERKIELTFVASDAGNPPLSSTMTLTILVEDINDNPPELVVQANSTIVENSEPNQLALRLLLRDLDEVSSNAVSCQPDANQQVPLRYEKSADGTIFSLYTKSSIDFEIYPKLYYAVTCTDLVEPRQIRRFNLTIVVEDVNDNPPVFRLNTKEHAMLYNISISEGEPSNRLVHLVSADDADSGEYGRVVYSLTDIDALKIEHQHFDGLFDIFGFISYFTIDEDTGGIFLTKRLDYETAHSMTFGVTAMDNPNGAEYNRHTVTVTVRVNILDINDNAPKLVSPNTLTLVEHMPIGTNIGVIQFTDLDTGVGGVVQVHGLLSETIIGINYRNVSPTTDQSAVVTNEPQFFKLTDSGQLVTMQSIDREKIQQFRLQILAIDSGEDIQLATTATVTVQIIDINDNNPVLHYPEPNSTVIFHPDLIVQPENLLLYKRLSTETVPVYPAHTTNLLSLIKQQQGQSTKFNISDYITASVVLTLEAEDYDIGSNADIIFELLHKCNGSRYFSVDSKSGEIHFRLQTVNKSIANSVLHLANLQYFPTVNIYHMCVKMSDKGKPPLSTNVQFWLDVKTPVTKFHSRALWPSDASGVENFAIAADTDLFADPSSSIPLGTGVMTKFVKQPTVDSDGSFGSVNISNTIIAALVVIFAITFFCALAAALLWAHSKHRKGRLNERGATATHAQPVFTQSCSKWLLDDMEKKPIKSAPQNNQNEGNGYKPTCPAVVIEASSEDKDEIEVATNRLLSHTGSNLAPLLKPSEQVCQTVPAGLVPFRCRNEQTFTNSNNIKLQIISSMCDLIPCCGPQQRISEGSVVTASSFQRAPEDSYSLKLPLKIPHTAHSNVMSNLSAQGTYETFTGTLSGENSGPNITCVPISLMNNLSTECPTHGPQLLIHSPTGCPNMLENAVLKSPYYTVQSVSEKSCIHHPMNYSVPESELTCNTHPLGCSQMSDGEGKTFSWISVPLMADPLGNETPVTGVICWDPRTLPDGRKLSLEKQIET